MSEYKKLKEWFGDKKRGDGRKFVHDDGKKEGFFEPIFLDAYGDWVGLSEKGNTQVFDSDNSFKLYTPPKKTKSILMYKPIYNFLFGSPQKSYGSYSDVFHSHKEYFDTKNVVGWITVVAEVEDDT